MLLLLRPHQTDTTPPGEEVEDIGIDFTYLYPPGLDEEDEEIVAFVLARYATRR